MENININSARKKLEEQVRAEASSMGINISEMDDNQAYHLNEHFSNKNEIMHSLNGNSTQESDDGLDKSESQRKREDYENLWRALPISNIDELAPQENTDFMGKFEYFVDQKNGVKFTNQTNIERGRDASKVPRISQEKLIDMVNGSDELSDIYENREDRIQAVNLLQQEQCMINTVKVLADYGYSLADMGQLVEIKNNINGRSVIDHAQEYLNFDEFGFLATFVDDKTMPEEELEHIIYKLDELSESIDLPRKDAITRIRDAYNEDQKVDIYTIIDRMGGVSGHIDSNYKDTGAIEADVDKTVEDMHDVKVTPKYDMHTNLGPPLSSEQFREKYEKDDTSNEVSQVDMRSVCIGDSLVKLYERLENSFEVTDDKKSLNLVQSKVKPLVMGSLKTLYDDKIESRDDAEKMMTYLNNLVDGMPPGANSQYINAKLAVSADIQELTDKYL